jgi:hypothetical protein
MSRWVSFLLAVLIGVAIGLYYGWVINPVEYIDTTPSSLLIDYQADYVLMVAEVYQAEGEIAQAGARLAFLGEAPPIQMVQEALGFATRQGYADADLRRMRDLLDALQAQVAPLETAAP